MDAIKSGLRKFSQETMTFSSGGKAQPGYAEMADDDAGATIRVEVPVAGGQEGPDGRRMSVAMDVSENTECIVQVQIPENIKVGEAMVVVGPKGQKLRVRVPPGYSAGDMLFVPVPKDENKTEGLMAWARRRMSVLPGTSA